jgi:hypothetical protein
MFVFRDVAVEQIDAIFWMYADEINLKDLLWQSVAS